MRHNGNKLLHLMNSKMNITGQFITFKHEMNILISFPIFPSRRWLKLFMFLVGFSKAAKSAIGPTSHKQADKVIPRSQD